MKSIALLIIASLFGATSAFTTPRPACTKLVPTTTSLNIDFFKSNVAEKMEVSTESAVDDECEVPEEELSESQILMQKVKDAGVAGIISYVFWEWAFWGVSIPVVIGGYYGVTGHWPDFADNDDRAKLAAEAFAFVNFARFAVPLRIGLALGTTPWVQANIVDRFMKKDPECEPMDTNGATDQ